MNTAEDLAAWLTAVWDEEEAAAEGNGTIAWLTFREPDGSMRYTAVASGDPDDHWVVDGEERTDYASARVVLDERQVLARIAADRKILALHVGGVSYPDECGLCNESLPCETVRLLASPYADRPGFYPEWLVERQGVEQ